MEEADKRKVTDEADEARKRTEARERRYVDEFILAALAGSKMMSCSRTDLHG